MLKVGKRIFDEGSVEELQYDLNKYSWKEVVLEPDVNGKFDYLCIFSIITLIGVFP
jgi:hypothetical protein